MDWQQVERESRLFTDGDFDWSEPPQRSRRRATEVSTPSRGRRDSYEPVRATRTAYDLEYEPESLDEDGLRIDHERPIDHDRPVEHQPRREDLVLEVREPWDLPTETHNHFDEMMAQWNAAYGDGARRDSNGLVERAFDLSDPGPQTSAPGARRTVLITGRGDQRYLPAPRRRRSSELRFHERSGFSPDRAGLWAVLLGVALVIGCIVH